MPRIRSYTNDVNAPQASGQQAAAAAGAASSIREGEQSAIGSITRGIGQVGQAVEQHNAMAETSKLAADIAAIQAQLTVDWNDTVQTADPNDHELAERFRTERVEPALAAIGENISTTQGRDLYDRSVAGIRAHMLTTTAADQSTLAGKAAIVNASTVLNQTSSAAYADPAGIHNYMALLDTTLSGMTGLNGMSTTERAAFRAKAQEQIALAAVQGAAERNPQATRERLAAGDYSQWLDGPTTARMQNFADTVERGQIAQVKADQAEALRANKANAERVANEITAATIMPDGTMHMPQDYFAQVQKLAMMPDVDPSLPRAMISAGRALAKQDVATSDPDTYLDFLDRAGRGQLTMQEIFQARGEGRLTNKDYSFMLRWQKELASNPERREQQRNLNQFFSGMKAFITKSNMLVADAEGNQRYSEYVRAMSPRYWAGVSAGQKPEDLFKQFQADIRRYQIPMSVSTERLTSGIERPNAPLPPIGMGSPAEAVGTAGVPTHVAPARKPGESADAYLKRAGAPTPAPVAPPSPEPETPEEDAEEDGEE